ncbi:CDP-diacylglycerol--glycerol-3-phosphate 3-phosphatidyltransferase [Streptomyces althioticus]|jgi:CDP-diacylglycerol--glycerol-3-phosphate 3-phosphatidyltransferase|uniref:CDP-diacylglycerol--glycerol-3-phosphate 3-phosphatidyltransferase n=1 Tax=Actinomycetes TaxID=1760 RepID=UPI0018765D44|nr:MULTISPECIES: CDP-diacylglycerol--glycerol-3-phosphate 3-phosphatidyltransferase [Actinomycetes]MBM4828239.1 CDP-diacylglycerol--glycerol-3-phosphate 3-phosphatidyltransferase [Actinospica acidiphila]WTC22714.1 CDP-diacylglycerol--glycerol-3-phosphate 3-phosphatidyltransferase [Streptomyces althioticus]GGT70414.1 CDP-diacylglycerol--glycerol-3-phosphate 3-phosphatidyltransferase [Streptomyces matensis]
MTGVPASAAGGPSGARRAKGPASGGLTPAAGRALAREARDTAPGDSGDGRARRAAPVPEEVLPAAPSSPQPSQEGAGTAEAQGSTRAPRGGKIAAAAVDQASVWNIANLLTMLRLLLVPAFVMLMLADGGYDPAWRSLAWAAFAIAMITDLFDGHLARTYNLVTDFGKIADPIADKAIMGAALICLSALGDLPWWVTGVILGRELGITLLRFLVIRYGVIPASRGGKLKTLTQGVAVGMYVLALTGWLATLRWWVMAAAVVLTVATGLDYVKQAIVLRRQGIAERKAALEETEE